jgi:hypothetical protein
MEDRIIQPEEKAVRKARLLVIVANIAVAWQSVIAKLP